MTKLEAVNQILMAVGEAPVTALATGGTNEISVAETVLDRETKAILSSGWWCNTLVDVSAKPGLVKLTTTGSGTFTFGETVTRGGATGTYCYTDGVYVYVYNDSTTAFSAGTLTGATSGATRTITAVATSSSGKVAIDTDWLFVEASQIGYELRRPIQRGNFLFNPDDNTFLFSSTVRLRIYENVDFIDLPQTLAQYCVASAALKFQRFMKRGQTDDAMLQQEWVAAKIAAEREDESSKGVNVLNTSEARRIRGNRSRTTGWASEDRNYA